MSKTFEKVYDARGRRVRGLWLRNNLFYARIGGLSRMALHDAHTVPQASAALQALRAKQKAGEIIIAQRKCPTVSDCCDNYAAELDKKKRPGTANRERSSLGESKAKIIKGRVLSLPEKRQRLSIDLDAHPDVRDMLGEAIKATGRNRTSLSIEAIRAGLPHVLAWVHEQTGAFANSPKNFDRPHESDTVRKVLAAKMLRVIGGAVRRKIRHPGGTPHDKGH